MKSNKNTWFKHFNSASGGNTLASLYASNDYELIALFWLILELVSRFEKVEDRGTITISERLLAREFGRTVQKTMRNTSKLLLKTHMRFESVTEGFLKITIPNWLEYQVLRSKQSSDKKRLGSPRLKTKDIRQQIPNETSEQSSSDELSSNFDPRLLLDLYNANRGRLAAAQYTDNRRKPIRARWKDVPDANYWTEVIKRMAASDFCCGGGPKKWRATFDFLLKPDTHVKVMEGKYDNHSQNTPKAKITFIDYSSQEFTENE